MFRFYDDELHNLILVSDRNFKEIIDYTSNYDFHPPLHYLINRITLQLFGLNEFWLSLPSTVFIICSIILAARLVQDITGSIKYSLVSGFIIALNPLILLWSSSLRWYPLWTFLAVVSIYTVVKLFSTKKKGSHIILKGGLIITLTLSLYTNYQTIILIASFIITAIVLDIKNKKDKYYHLKLLTPVIACVISLFIPYLNVFQNHLATFFQRKEIYSGYSSASHFFSGAYFLFSILFGNSIYPWDPKFIILIFIASASGLGVLIYCKIHHFSLLKTKIHSFIPEEKKELYYLVKVLTVTLILLFLSQSVITGSVQPRGLLILPILLVIIIAVSFYLSNRNDDRKLFFLISSTLVSFSLIWFIGSNNVISKKSLHKAGLMDPINEVTLLVKNIIDKRGSKITVITYDPVLTYYLAKTQFSKNITIFSPYLKESNKLLVSANGKLNNHSLHFDSTAILIFIQSYPGTLIPLKEKLDNMRRYIFNEGVLMKGPIRLGYDSDSMMKRKIFPSAKILDWRYTINILHSKNYWDRKVLEELNHLKVY
jgi:uncharacterized membrane protein